MSNFLVPHLEELLGARRSFRRSTRSRCTRSCSIARTRAFCKHHDIVVEAYSPLTHGKRIDDPVVSDVAARVRRTNAQVLLRWGIQHGMVVLPKSVNEGRIKENAAVFDFELDGDSMHRLDALEEGAATGWDPRQQK